MGILETWLFNKEAVHKIDVGKYDMTRNRSGKKSGVMLNHTVDSRKCR